MKQRTISMPAQEGKFLIYGWPPGAKYEQLLISESFGVMTIEHAERVKTVLETKHRCKNVRIKEIPTELEKPDFVGTIL